MFGFKGRSGRKEESAGSGRELRCSFCNKSQRDVRKLVAGPNVYICDECVDICLDILSATTKDDERSSEARTAGSSAFTTMSCSLCRMPVAVREGLPVRERGALCPGCVGEIEAALAARTN